MTTIVTVAVSGCSMPKAKDFKPSKLFSLGDDDEPEESIPVRMVGTWTDTVLTKAGQKPQRGFGGRLIFYGEDAEKPIIVDGQLVVYAFDESGREPTDNKPTRRYVFPPHQMPLHMSKSNLGATYSFWLPWDEAGGPQTEVSLICRFEPKGGAVITSEQTRHRLPGSLTPDAVGHRNPPKLPEGVPARPAQITLENLQANRAAEQAVQLASYASPIAPNQNVTSIEPGVRSPVQPESRMMTTSIALPPNYKIPATVPATAQPAMPAAAYVPNIMQQPTNATPMPTNATPAPPMPQSMMPSTMLHGAGTQASAFQHGALGQLPMQRSFAPTGAWPPITSATSQGFGFPQTGQTSAAAPQAGGSLARATAARSTMWNNLQATQVGAAFPQSQQLMSPAVGQPQTIVQPATQPIPGPTPLTTTISYPQVAPQY